MNLNTKPRYPFSDTEKYIVLKGREEETPYSEIQKSILAATERTRPIGSLHQLYSRKLRDLTSTHFENSRPGTKNSLPKEDTVVIKPFKNEHSELKQHTREILINEVLENVSKFLE